MSTPFVTQVSYTPELIAGHRAFLFVLMTKHMLMEHMGLVLKYGKKNALTDGHLKDGFQPFTTQDFEGTPVLASQNSTSAFTAPGPFLKFGC